MQKLNFFLKFLRKNMVNTFITQFPLTKSIPDLNSQRLGKQRVEAQQILTALLSAHAIAKIYELPKCPSIRKFPDIEGDIKREEWYSATYKWYKSNVLANGQFLYRYEEKYSKNLLTPEYKPVKCGFVFHPMTVMWIGYENGLKYYINLCIIEWIDRGFKNNMKLHVFKYAGIPKCPWWVECKSLHYSHCSALLRKEKVRNEPVWYWNKPHISCISKSAWLKHGYLWIGHLTLAERKRIKDEEVPEYCDSIKNDFL